MDRPTLTLMLLAAIGVAAAGCAARPMDPTMLVGASENRAVILSDPDRAWRAKADEHCSGYGRTAKLRSVQQPDPPPQTVKTYLGAADMGPNKLYYFDCVET